MTTKKTMTAKRRTVPARQNDLSALFSAPTAPAKQDDKRRVSDIPLDDLADQIKAHMPGRVTERDAERVLAMIDGQIQEATTAIADALKVARPDRGRMTLSTKDGLKVTVNQSIPVSVDNRTVYVNVNVSVPGVMGQILSNYAARKSA